MSDINITFAIRASREAVWGALTDGAVTPAYYLGFQAEFDLTAGAPYRYSVGGGSMITGTVITVEPARTLITTFNGAWTPRSRRSPSPRLPSS